MLTLSSLITYICSSDNSGMKMLHLSYGYLNAYTTVISHREGQCLSEVKKVLRANPKALLRLRKNTVLPQGINKGSHISFGREVCYLGCRLI